MRSYNTDFIELQVAKQRLDVDLSLSRDVQQMLLPHTLPQLAGLDVDARYMAAQKVTGDLYDVFHLGEGKLGVVVADVSGKGVSASLHMAICRTLLHQIAGRYDSPARALSELNQALAGDVRNGIYITMAYAIIDLPAGNVILARAGHELPLFLKRDRATGLPVCEYVVSEGMHRSASCRPGCSTRPSRISIVPFMVGDVLLLYTDGLTEAPNSDEQEFGSARLSDALRSANQGSAKQINDAVLQAGQRFTGNTGLRDDFTLLTIKRV